MNEMVNDGLQLKRDWWVGCRIDGVVFLAVVVAVVVAFLVVVVYFLAVVAVAFLVVVVAFLAVVWPISLAVVEASSPFADVAFPPDSNPCWLLVELGFLFIINNIHHTPSLLTGAATGTSTGTSTGVSTHINNKI